MGLFAAENNFNTEILEASKASGVPVSIIKGFIAAESAFNPKAFKAEPQIQDGSYGLMQILHRTARGMGYQGPPEGLYEPAQNTRFGALLLRQLFKRFENPLDAISAYNQGRPRKAAESTAISKHIYGEPGPDWTYANQPYVDRVASYAAYYQTFERPDPARRQIITDAVKKKIFLEARATYKALLSEALTT